MSKGAKALPSVTGLQPTRARPKLYYGWWIVFGATLGTGLTAFAYVVGFTAFVIPVGAEFGASRASLSGIFSIAGLEGGILGPIVGYLIDKFGPRRVILLGTLMMAAGMFLLARAENLGMFYIYFVVFVTVGAGVGLGPPVMIVVANWFIRRRSLAMGLALSGVGVGGLMIPALTWVISRYGWREAEVMLGFLMLLIGVPASLMMKQRPELYGLLPDGDTSPEQAQAAIGQKEQEVDFTTAEAVKTWAFWLLSIGFTLRMFTQQAVVVHIIPSLVNMGHPTQTAAALVSLSSVLSIAGRMGFGWIADVAPKRLVLAVVMAMIAVASVLFLGASAFRLAVLAVALYGPGQGGAVTVMFSVRGDYFGRKAYGTIQGWMSTISMAGTILGPLLGGIIYDRTGSYHLMYVLLAVAAAVSSVTYFVTRKPAPKRNIVAAS